MRPHRLHSAVWWLEKLPRGSYLDVATGHGAMLVCGERLGFAPVVGTEIVPQLLDKQVVYAEAHALPFPDKFFDVVTMFDTLEHLLPGDDALACAELRRVARHHILVSANDAFTPMPAADQLHINVRPYEEWDTLLLEWFDGKATRLQPVNEIDHSVYWRADPA